MQNKSRHDGVLSYGYALVSYLLTQQLTCHVGHTPSPCGYALVSYLLTQQLTCHVGHTPSPCDYSLVSYLLTQHLTCHVGHTPWSYFLTFIFTSGPWFYPRQAMFIGLWSLSWWLKISITFLLFILLLLLLKKVGNARLGESDRHLISLNILSPRNQHIERQKRQRKKLTWRVIYHLHGDKLNIPVSDSKLMLGHSADFVSSHLAVDELFPVNPSAITCLPKMRLLLDFESKHALITEPKLILVKADTFYSFHGSLYIQQAIWAPTFIEHGMTHYLNVLYNLHLCHLQIFPPRENS